MDDQVGCPTWARNLARASCHLIRSGLEPSGVGQGNIYHYSDADQVSWFDFARQVFETAVRLGLLESTPDLSRVTTGEYPQVATRPRYSVLDNTAISESGFHPAPLGESLEACMKELTNELN